MKMKHIILGRNVGNSLGQIRSLGEAGLNPILVWIGEKSEVLESCKYLSESFSFPTISEGIYFLINYLENACGVKHVLTVDSDGLVAEINKYYTKLSKYCYFFNAGADNRLYEMMRKEKLCHLARKHGLLTPSTEIVKVGSLPMNITYPLLTKATDSFSASWKNCVRICKDKQDLLDFYQEVDAKELLIQNYIEKKNEFILVGIAINRGKDVIIPIEGSYYRIPDGYFGTYLYFNAISDIGKKLSKPVKAMLEEIGYEGVFEAEFIIDKEGNYYFLEINFRHTLWNHTFTDMGLNFCEIWSKAIVNRKFPEIILTSTKKRHVLIHEFVDFLWYAKSGKVNIFKWIFDFLNADSYVIYDRHDVMPFITYLRIILLKQIRLSL